MDSQQYLEQGRLARTVGTDQGDDFADVDLKADLIQDLSPPDVEIDLPGGQQQTFRRDGDRHGLSEVAIGWEKVIFGPCLLTQELLRYTISLFYLPIISIFCVGTRDVPVDEILFRKDRRGRFGDVSMGFHGVAPGCGYDQAHSRPGIGGDAGGGETWIIVTGIGLAPFPCPAPFGSAVTASGGVGFLGRG